MGFISHIKFWLLIFSGWDVSILWVPVIGFPFLYCIWAFLLWNLRIWAQFKYASNSLCKLHAHITAFLCPNIITQTDSCVIKEWRFFEKLSTVLTFPYFRCQWVASDVRMCISFSFPQCASKCNPFASHLN